MALSLVENPAPSAMRAPTTSKKFDDTDAPRTRTGVCVPSEVRAERCDCGKSGECSRQAAEVIQVRNGESYLLGTGRAALCSRVRRRRLNTRISITTSLSGCGNGVESKSTASATAFTTEDAGNGDRQHHARAHAEDPSSCQSPPRPCGCRSACVIGPRGALIRVLEVCNGREERWDESRSCTL